MRIRVKDVLDMLAEGATPAEILADFPDLEEADLRACIAYATRYVDHPVVNPSILRSPISSDTGKATCTPSSRKRIASGTVPDEQATRSGASNWSWS